MREVRPNPQNGSAAKAGGQVMRLQLVLVCVFVGASGCGDEPRPGASPAQRIPATDALCAEHGVEEAVCTKCQPALAAIFKDKGDWCAEHELPESFCPVCHPERGGRPVADVSAEEAPLDGTKVVLRSAEAVRAAAIGVTKAGSPSPTASLEVLGAVAYNALGRAEVNPRAAGVVRELVAEPGAHVVKGAPIAIIESATVGAEHARLKAAKARLSIAENAQTRLKPLVERQLAMPKDLLAAELEIALANADIETARSALEVIGAGNETGNAYTLRAPISGHLANVAAVAGRMVEEDDVLCEVVDTAMMWVELQIPEAETDRVAIGQAASIRVSALGEREYKGVIEYIAPEIDRRTRSAIARVRLDNPDGVLRAHQLVRAAIDLGPSRARAVVPADAVQRAKGVELVFVQLSPEKYEARRVHTGERLGDLQEVFSGIEPGELVAVRGSFLLKTETLKGSIGAGCCEVD